MVVLSCRLAGREQRAALSQVALGLAVLAEETRVTASMMWRYGWGVVAVMLGGSLDPRGPDECRRIQPGG